MIFENLDSLEEYLDYDEIDANMLFEDDEDELVFHNGELLEASAPRMTAKERQLGHNIGRLMTALNKRPAYNSAKQKFIKVFKTEARKTVKDNNLSPMVLKKLDKITLREI